MVEVTYSRWKCRLRCVTCSVFVKPIASNSMKIIMKSWPMKSWRVGAPFGSVLMCAESAHIFYEAYIASAIFKNIERNPSQIITRSKRLAYFAAAICFSSLPSVCFWIFSSVNPRLVNNTYTRRNCLLALVYFRIASEKKRDIWIEIQLWKKCREWQIKSMGKKNDNLLKAAYNCSLLKFIRFGAINVSGHFLLW